MDKFKKLTKTYGELLDLKEDSKDYERKDSDEKLSASENNMKLLKKEIEDRTKDLVEKENEPKDVKESIENIRNIVLPDNVNATLEEIEEKVRMTTSFKILDMKREELLLKVESLRKTKSSLEKDIKSRRRELERVVFEHRNAVAKAARLKGRERINTSYSATARSTGLTPIFIPSDKPKLQERQSLPTLLSSYVCSQSKNGVLSSMQEFGE